MLPKHLGGHANKTNIDEGALDWAIRSFNAKTFLDIGAGPGGMTELATKKGLNAIGIDGDFTVDRFDNSKFLIHDYTDGPAPLNKQYDIGWSCEFVEHVYEHLIPNYMPSFQSCKIVIMTYAPPGYGGYHHVNEQPEKYWINTFAQYGLKYDPELTVQLRKHTTMNLGKKGKKAFIKNRGLVFYK
jgi:hypothetical protein